MKSVRVHITLNEEARASAGSKEAVLSKIQAAAAAENMNLRRFERHGVLSTDIAEEDIAKIRKIEGVKSVSIDAAQHAI